MSALRPKKIALGVVLVVAGAIAVAGYLFFAPRRVPEGQRALVRLDGRSIETLRGDFNAGAGGTRLLVLLSPT